MNILTFDIEEWYIARSLGGGSVELYRKYDRYLNEILDKLEEKQIHATFFCLGMMAEDFPEVVRSIYSRGHEIGCHSHRHLWANKMSEAEFRDDTYEAVTALEQCIGEKVESYRAPAFSIGESNLWAFDVLAENGITRDASVFPAPRDFGGFPSFGIDEPVVVERNGWQMQEFPIPLTKVLRRDIAYSGGGYFRFFPKGFIFREIRSSNYCMMYFHLNDFIAGRGKMMDRKAYESYFKEKGTLTNRFKRYLKSNLGKETAYLKLQDLLDTFTFTGLNNAPTPERHLVLDV